MPWKNENGGTIFNCWEKIKLEEGRPRKIEYEQNST